MTDILSGGQLVVRTLAALGVRRFFGVPGGQTLAILDAIHEMPGQVEFVTARHEGAAAVMADAHGRLTGRPAVCLATTGPGATNLLTGVGGALRDSSPVIVITCNNNAINIAKDDAQNADHVALFRPLTKWSRLVAHSTGVQQAVEEAFISAMSGNPGPVHLDFTRDSIESPAVDADEPPDRHPLLDWVGQRVQPDPDAIERAVESIRSARRPVLWIGNGVNRSGAGEAALRLAEVLHAPLLTTFNGIGAVPTTHPLVFGPHSRMGTTLSTEVLREADLVVAVGNSLNAVSTTRWTLRPPAIVQLDIEPTTIGRYYADRTYGVVGDAAAGMHALVARLADATDDARAARGAWVAGLQTARDRWWADSVEHARAAADGRSSPFSIVQRLRDVSPDDTLLIPDAGNPGVWSFAWEVRQPRTYLKPVGFGNMGFAIPAAVAAAALDPERPVLVLVGDGSLGMTMGELETVARVGGRVCIVVLNDDGYGNIRQEQENNYGGRTIGVDFGPADYPQVARGLGLAAERVADVDALVAKVGEAFDRGTPALYDIALDTSYNAWTFPYFAAEVDAD